ncbi:MAG TPA: hypothetical protein VJ793_00230 [Anaerolineae bacterium]|nr:hypothetical protein [Anaerolineae bacterium]
MNVGAPQVEIVQRAEFAPERRLDVEANHLPGPPIALQLVDDGLGREAGQSEIGIG